jgi:hypothetical protein
MESGIIHSGRLGLKVGFDDGSVDEWMSLDFL